MVPIVSFLFLISTGSAFAVPNYKIGFDVTIPDHAHRMGTVSVAEGGSSMVSWKDTQLILKPTQHGERTVKIDVEIIKAGATPGASPTRGTLITRLNSAAELSQKSSKGELLFSIRVTPSML